MKNTNKIILGEIGSGMSWYSRQLKKAEEQNAVIILDPKNNYLNEKEHKENNKVCICELRGEEAQQILEIFQSNNRCNS